MAIKDQCEQCRKYNKDCTERIEFNGNSCSSYARPINLEKESNSCTTEEEQILSQPIVEQERKIDYPNPDVSMHGWLVFFLFSIGLGGLISAAYPIFTYNVTEYDGSHFLAITDVAQGVMLFSLAIYTIYAFIKRKPNAVFLAKMYVVVVFVTNLLSILLGADFKPTGIGSLSQLIRSLVWGVIWFLYLTFSEQVEEVIPKTYRKVFSRDYYIMIAFIILPLLMLGLGIGELEFQHKESEEQFLSSTNLAYNEYTDGRIVFTKPDGYTCEKQELANPQLTLYDLELGESAWIRICSDYDTEVTTNNFNVYWEGWKDKELEDVDSREILNEKRSINGNPYFIKTLRYGNDSETPIFWHFVLIFNARTGKVCVISYYQIGESENCLDSLLNSIRF